MSVRSRLLPLVLVLAACSGGGKDPVRDAAPATKPPGNPVKTSRIADGAKLWKTYCALCHGPEAKGYAADNAPSLVSPTFLATVSDVFLRTSIAQGRPGTPMAAYGRAQGGPLTDDDILKIIAWVRSLHTIDPVKPTMPGKGDAARGAVVYEASCKACHGDQMTRGKAPWLANGVFLQQAGDAFLRHAIEHGRPGTEMAAFGALTAVQLDDVVALLRSWEPAPSTTPPPPPPDPHAGHDHGGTGQQGPVLDMPIVINPDGKAPKFNVKKERFVAAAEVAKALKEGRRMIIVDARAASDWQNMRIPGAVPVPYYAMDQIDKLPNDGTWILTYCACPHHASGVVLDELRKRGYKNNAIIDEGVLFWRQQGFPIEGAAPPQVPRSP